MEIDTIHTQTQTQRERENAGNSGNLVYKMPGICDVISIMRNAV